MGLTRAVALPVQDVLGKVSILFDYLSTAERKYADHNEQFR